MKRAFTLIEMMIVVALIATLMTVVFRLSSASSEDTKRNKTILRLQKLENCLAGYYAAYGNYPPVRLHNSRDIYQKADAHGIQSTGDANENIWGWKTIGDSDEQEAWNQVKSACEAQPVGAEYPFSTDQDMQDDIVELVESLQRNVQNGIYTDLDQKKQQSVQAGFDAIKENLGRFQNARTAFSWRDIQVFKFGLMSFLLPRYQMMMTGNSDLYTYFAQWSSNNGAVSNPMTGEAFTSQQLIDLNQRIERGTATQQDRAQVMNIASDAVCARWLPNLAGICAGTRSGTTYYGVKVVDGNSSECQIFNLSEEEGASFPPIHIYSPDGDSTRDQYILDSMTVLDGWRNEFYYYSPSPHQTYQLWSSGANGRTFPPWISRASLSASALECVFKWTQDDIKGMSN